MKVKSSMTGGIREGFSEEVTFELKPEELGASLRKKKYGEQHACKDPGTGSCWRKRNRSLWLWGRVREGGRGRRGRAQQWVLGTWGKVWTLFQGH